MENYLDVNRDHWNQRTPAHLTSDFYDVDGWLAGKECLREIELQLLPKSLAGKTLLHLQCHFGQDTLSLARRGAQVTGVDLSDQAIGWNSTKTNCPPGLRYRATMAAQRFRSGSQPMVP